MRGACRYARPVKARCHTARMATATFRFHDELNAFLRAPSATARSGTHVRATRR